MVRSLGLACGKKALRLVEVFGRVDADGLDIGQSDLDLVAVLQPAQLLQALRQFERRLGQTRDLAQHVSTVGIEADVLEEGVRETRDTLLTSFSSCEMAAAADTRSSFCSRLQSWPSPTPLLREMEGRP